jgi:hypothetical protein
MFHFPQVTWLMSLYWQTAPVLLIAVIGIFGTPRWQLAD